MSSLVSISNALSHYRLLEGVSDSARLDTELLLAYALQQDRSYLYTWPEKTLSAAEEERFNRYFVRRQQGEPIAYIMGEKPFWTLDLQVDSSTLIPRPETEQLVDIALALFDADTASTPRQVIDLGTGTGAIALALASERPAWKIIAIDQSEQACQLAERNRQRYHLDNVEVVCSNWLQGVGLQRVDMIVSNPPYIDPHDPHLEQGDVRFEPRSALIADDHGLADIKIIAEQAYHRLLGGGWLLIEHGYQQGELVRALLEGQGFQHCISHQDLAGHPRVTVAQQKESADNDD